MQFMLWLCKPAKCSFGCIALLLLLCCTAGGCAQTTAQQSGRETRQPVNPVQSVVATPTLSGPEKDATKMARFNEERRLVDAESTKFALGTPYPTLPPIILPTSGPLNTPVPGIHFECIDPNPQYDYASCWNGSLGNEYIAVATGAPDDNPSQGVIEVYTRSLGLDAIGASQFYPTPMQGGRVSIASVAWPHMTLITERESQTIAIFVFNLLTRIWVEPGACHLYPIAIHADALSGTGDDARYVVREATFGTGNGNFGWLSWGGDMISSTLALSLIPPGNSATYINPNNHTDHTVSVGDWVLGRPQVSDSPVISNALSALNTNFAVVVPVWDQATEQSNNLRYRVSGYAWIYRNYNVNLGQPNRISFRYWGPANCAESP